MFGGDWAFASEASPPPPAAHLGAMPNELVTRVLETQHLSLPQRMRAISEAMLGVPYVDDPLGEGAGIDPDPFTRYDAYDCLTFLEEVLALSLSPSPYHASQVRLRLRYGDQVPAYHTRRHFMTLQWIPGNTIDGWLRDTTAEYGPTTRFEKEVTMGVWRAWQRRENYALTDEQLPLGTMKLQVLSLDQAIEAADRIRPGSIIMTVREDRSWIPLWVTHVGFVIDGDEPTIRHASRMKSAMQVRDHGLVWYLEHLKTYSNWKVAGISILEPIPMGPRRMTAP